MQTTTKKCPTVTIEQKSSRRFPVFVDDQPPVMVVGHERSGTHFMMNTLAACYGYVSNPWVDLDYNTFPINYFRPDQVANILSLLGDKKLSSVIKSHHHPDFFKDQIDLITSKIKIIYIYRNPADVMISFWKLLHGIAWKEGPRVDSPLRLARCEPSGQLMRYQMRQYPSMVHRWADHVSAWFELVRVSERVTSVSYEDLDQRFPETVTTLADFMEREPAEIIRPSRTDAGVSPSSLAQGIAEHRPDREAIAAWCRKAAPAAMEAAGY